VVVFVLLQRVVFREERREKEETIVTEKERDERGLLCFFCVGVHWMRLAIILGQSLKVEVIYALLQRRAGKQQNM